MFFASFIIYMITAWFLTLLPLPSMDTLATMPKVHHNFKPFLFLSHFFQKSGFQLKSPSTWVTAFKSPYFYSPAFNVLLTLPFGIYLRKYFNRSLFTTFLLGFLLSFFYELTQYTGIYGLYPQAYRIGDIDDIILNTFGTVLGYVITPIISRLLPTPEKEGIPVEKQLNVGLIRRTLAYTIDLFLVKTFQTIISITMGVFQLSFSYQKFIGPLVLYSLYFFLLPYLTKGETLGQKFIKIQILSTRNKPLAFWQLMVRNGLLLLITKFGYSFTDYLASRPVSSFSTLLTLLFTSLLFLFPFVMIFTRILKKKRYFYEVFSFTILTSEKIQNS